MAAVEGPSDQAVEYVPEKVKKAEKKLEDNPYDLDAWSILIREAQNQPIDKARKTYERLVTQFPSSGRFWKLYIEAEYYRQTKWHVAHKHHCNKPICPFIICSQPLTWSEIWCLTFGSKSTRAFYLDISRVVNS